MKSLLFMFLALALALQIRGYQYDKPVVNFQQEDAAYPKQTAVSVQPGTTVIKGNNGRDYEVTMSASRKLYEARLPPKEEVFVVQQVDQPAIQQPYFYPQQVTNSLPNLVENGNFQQLNFNSNQHNGVAAVNNAQNHYNQFTVNSNHQHLQQQQLQHQQQIARAQQQPQEQTGIFSQRAQQQQAGYFYQNIPQQQQQQQQQFGTFPQTVQQHAGILNQKAPQKQSQQQRQQQSYPQQYEQYLQQPLRNNYLPNPNNLLNDLVNNHKYVSQSEATQLDVYAYKQINGNLRPFTRTISKCDVSGQCEPQNADAEGSSGNDFHHQQVLKQTKTLVEPQADKCQNKLNYQFTGNALTDNAAKAQRGIAVKKGSDLKDRRLFPYSEVVILQYPQN